MTGRITTKPYLQLFWNIEFLVEPAVSAYWADHVDEMIKLYAKLVAALHYMH